MDSKIPNKVQSILYALENEVQKITTVEAMKNIRDAFTVIASNFEAAIKGLEAQITSKKKQPFWDVKEVADYLMVTTVTIYSWIHLKDEDKKLEATYVGDKIRISQEALDKFLARHEKYRPNPKKTIQRRKKMNETLLTVKEVAQHFGVSTVTVYSWIRSGKLKSILVGNGKIRIRPSDLPDDLPSRKLQ